MSDETKPEDEVQELEAEAKPGKKAKSAKKKATEPQSEEAQVETEPASEASAPAEATAEAQPAAKATGKSSTGAEDDVFTQGVQALLRSDYAAADNFFGQALTTSRKSGDHVGQADALEQLGHLCFLRGAEALAQDYYQQARQLRSA